MDSILYMAAQETKASVQTAGAPFHVMYLQNQFQHRADRNPKYSLRAFAKDIGIDAGQLSKTLAGKLLLSMKRAGLIVTHLNIDSEERELFLRSVAQEQSSQLVSQPNSARSRHEKFDEAVLDYDRFLAMSDLTHFAVLELTFLDGFKSDPRWMARKLKIPVIEVEAAINRLIRLGVLSKTESGYRKTQKNISSGYIEFSSEALRALHRQVLKQAIESLSRDSHELRSNHSVTLAIDSSKLKIAREMTMKFLNELTQVLESGKQSKLYQISFNLFPLQQ
ncbi:MAG: DUF4423 domain-containing protein [Proteobacteria bacterium]|nr:DUF4423 domain-containing protein [Pseudomonadota bacterium]